VHVKPSGPWDNTVNPRAERSPPKGSGFNNPYSFVVGMDEKPSRLGVSGETSTFSGWDTAYVPLEGWLARSN